MEASKRKVACKKDDIRSFYDVDQNGKSKNNRHLVPLQWRDWIDALIANTRYVDLLRIHNALVHADVLRTIFLSTKPMEGPSLPGEYNVALLITLMAEESHTNFMAREIIELSHDVALYQVQAFAEVLKKTKSKPG